MDDADYLQRATPLCVVRAQKLSFPFLGGVYVHRVAIHKQQKHGYLPPCIVNYFIDYLERCFYCSPTISSQLYN